jgi:hypothetical protein
LFTQFYPRSIVFSTLKFRLSIFSAFGGTAEASMPPYDWALLADLTNDGLINLTDFAFQAADWLNSADRQPGDLNRDSLVDISDLALLVDDWLEQTAWY